MVVKNRRNRTSRWLEDPNLQPGTAGSQPARPRGSVLHQSPLYFCAPRLKKCHEPRSVSTSSRPHPRTEQCSDNSVCARCKHHCASHLWQRLTVSDRLLLRSVRAPVLSQRGKRLSWTGQTPTIAQIGRFRSRRGFAVFMNNLDCSSGFS